MSTSPFVHSNEWRMHMCISSECEGILRATSYVSIITLELKRGKLLNLYFGAICCIYWLLTKYTKTLWDLNKRASLTKGSQELWGWMRLKYCARCSQCRHWRGTVPVLCAHSPSKVSPASPESPSLHFLLCFSATGSPCVVHASLKLLGSRKPSSLGLTISSFINSNGSWIW